MYTYKPNELSAIVTRFNFHNVIWLRERIVSGILTFVLITAGFQILFLHAYPLSELRLQQYHYFPSLFSPISFTPSNVYALDAYSKCSICQIILLRFFRCFFCLEDAWIVPWGTYEDTFYYMHERFWNVSVEIYNLRSNIIRMKVLFLFSFA